MPNAETLGLLLVRESLITREQLYDALRLQRQNGRLLGTCLLSLGYINADRLLKILSEQLQVPALPPGVLSHADPRAVRLVPQELVLRLRIVPYSFDGTVLGVALADGRVLEHLQEVALHSRSAVGAYVALEMEIETVIGKLYGMDSAMESEFDGSLPGRPRPQRLEPGVDEVFPADKEIPARNFGPALGLESEQPVLLTDPKPPSIEARTATPIGRVRPKNKLVTGGLPPQALVSEVPAKPAPVPKEKSRAQKRSSLAEAEKLERMSLYEAVERIYEAGRPTAVGILVGQALLNYFTRVLVFSLGERQLRVVGFGGVQPERGAMATEAIPEIMRGVSQGRLSYGLSDADLRCSELCDLFGLEEGRTALIAQVPYGQGQHLLVFGDNGDSADLYEDLHDVELLLKEATTAMGMLGSGAP